MKFAARDSQAASQGMPDTPDPPPFADSIAASLVPVSALTDATPEHPAPRRSRLTRPGMAVGVALAIIAVSVVAVNPPAPSQPVGAQGRPAAKIPDRSTPLIAPPQRDQRPRRPRSATRPAHTNTAPARGTRGRRTVRGRGTRQPQGASNDRTKVASETRPTPPVAMQRERHAAVQPAHAGRPVPAGDFRGEFF